MIPRPAVPSKSLTKTGSGSLAAQMQVDEDEFYKILNVVASLCDRHCSLPDKRASRQGKEAVFEEALLAFPILAQYENMWPVTVMMKQHCQMSKGYGVKSFGTGKPKIAYYTPGKIVRRIEAPQRARHRPVDGSRKGDTAGHRSATPAKASKVSRGTRAAVSDGEHGKGRKVNKSRPQEVSASCMPAGPPPSSVAPAAIVVPPRQVAPDSSECIVTFLRGLAQDLSGLLSIFVQYGVQDEPSLRGMLRMEGWHSWLYGWVRAKDLTELQYAMIVKGLEKVV